MGEKLKFQVSGGWLLSYCLCAVLSCGTMLAATPVVANSDFNTVITDFVERELAGLGSEVHAQVISKPPAGISCPEPTPSLPRGYHRRSSRLHVAVSCGERQFFIQARISVIGEYLRATRDIPAGTTLHKDMFERTEGDITAMLDNLVRDPRSALDSTALRSLKRGQPLLTRNLKPPRLVERGERIRVIARGRGFRIARKGEALESGGLGDRVDIRISRRQTLTATISGPGVAVLSL